MSLRKRHHTEPQDITVLCNIEYSADLMEFFMPKHPEKETPEESWFASKILDVFVFMYQYTCMFVHVSMYKYTFRCIWMGASVQPFVICLTFISTYLLLKVMDSINNRYMRSYSQCLLLHPFLLLHHLFLLQIIYPLCSCIFCIEIEGQRDMCLGW